MEQDNATLPFTDDDGDDYLGLPKFTVRCGDAQQHLSTMPKDAIDAIICDPPSGKEIMGIKWDGDKGGRDKWIEWLQGVMKEAIRVLRPGGWAVVWALPQTSHWTATACENAGFEIRDVIHHVFGNGLPKVKGVRSTDDVRAAIAAAGRTLEGKGTQLKPSGEHWIICRKPIGVKNVAECILLHGTGAFNLDESRIPGGDEQLGRWPANVILTHSPNCRPVATSVPVTGIPDVLTDWECTDDCPVKLMDSQSGISMTTGKAKVASQGRTGGYKGGWKTNTIVTYSDVGGASRYFAQFSWEPEVDAITFQYVNKPSRKERHAGTEELWELVDEVTWGSEVTQVKRAEIRAILEKSDIEPYRYADFSGLTGDPLLSYEPVYMFDHIPTDLLVFFDGLGEDGQIIPLRNIHPTVKPVNLIRYFVKMFVPPRGVVLDMFAGSGTTGVACYLEGRDSYMIELDSVNCDIINSRMKWAVAEYKKQGLPVIVRKTIKKTVQPGTIAMDLWGDDDDVDGRLDGLGDRTDELSRGEICTQLQEVIASQIAEIGVTPEGAQLGEGSVEDVNPVEEVPSSETEVPVPQGVGELHDTEVLLRPSDGVQGHDRADAPEETKGHSTLDNVKDDKVKIPILNFPGSSNVISVSFEEDPASSRDSPKGKLIVVYKGNRKYAYIGVPKARWDDVVVLNERGGSIGEFINNSIKLKYEFE